MDEEQALQEKELLAKQDHLNKQEKQQKKISEMMKQHVDGAANSTSFSDRDVVDPQYYLPKIPKELMNLLTSEPKDAKPVPLGRWKDLGPLDLSELIMKNNKDIDYQNNDLGIPSKSFDFDIVGQLDDKRKKMHGIGRANYKDLIYEGQFLNG